MGRAISEAAKEVPAEEEAPVEHQGKQPEPFFPLVSQIAFFGQFCFGVSEQGTES